jgi:NAD(P)-dependent dehydrogenase (short-subunit alcohol dehydrogenase family)
MGNALHHKTVVVVGGGSGIARAVALRAHEEGARVVVAGRDKAKLADAYDGLDVTAETVDVTDDSSISTLAGRAGRDDHVVSTASARARGKLADLDRKNLQLSFDTKVIGPTMLAKHFAQQMNPGGSFVLFSGVNAFKVNVGYLGVAITNGAVDFLTRSLAVNSHRSGSTPSPPVSSTPGPGTGSVRTASATTSSTSVPATPHDASGRVMMWPAPCCSR